MHTSIFYSAHHFQTTTLQSSITKQRRIQIGVQKKINMPPTKNLRTISQTTFDDLVRENIDDLDMDPTEALQDAIDSLTLQGVDLSGIVTCVPGENGIRDNPVIQCLEKLKEDDMVVEWLDKLRELCCVEGSGNVAIATRNGGVELVCGVCMNGSKTGDERLVCSGLRVLGLLIHDMQSRESFRSSGGPKLVMEILNNGNQNAEILNSGFAVVAAASTNDEILKELFMELKIDVSILQILREQNKGNIPSIYDAIRVLLTPDDGRVVASQVYGYARQFAKTGIAEALVDSLLSGLSSPSLVSASIALKAVAVNDEICKSVAEKGGIDAILRCLDDSCEQGNKAAARASCALLSKLAGSDSNKTAIIEKDGMEKLIKLSARFSDDSSVLQEVMSIFTVLSLRSPENAARAMEAGAGDLAIQAMQKFPDAQQMQRSACQMIRNLVVRNSENRTLLLKNGIETYIRKAKQNHGSCKAAASDALRDLGLDNYNCSDS